MAALLVPDPVVTLRALLEAGWTKANTDEREPNFHTAEDIKVVPGTFKTAASASGAPGDDLILYESAPRQFQRYGINYEHAKRSGQVSVDVRTTVSRAHFGKMLGELERIVMANRKAPATLTGASETVGPPGYDALELLQGGQDFSSRGAGFWRAVLEVRLRTYVESIV